MAVVTVAIPTMEETVEAVAIQEEIEEVMEEVIDQATTEMVGIEMVAMGKCHYLVLFGKTDIIRVIMEISSKDLHYIWINPFICVRKKL